MVMKFLENYLKERGNQLHSKSRTLISSAAPCGPAGTGAVIFPLGETKQNVLLFPMLARVHRTASDLQDPRAPREDLVLKVPEVKEVPAGRLGLLALVEIQALQAPRVRQAPRDPMDSLFPENKAAKGPKAMPESQDRPAEPEPRDCLAHQGPWDLQETGALLEKMVQWDPGVPPGHRGARAHRESPGQVGSQENPGTTADLVHLD